ncbi:hypothetical protein [Synechococcus sp. BA-132 BA5]|uniref:hypothetical protein n=1 Tax=Synechococcus sp. BA-132 BA5 TaxID=3110252 RepID=UPI002B20D481|nr:hypothetical protein [Synechococcus sp. BA-132 BA5]MEA5414093.1 hypothetical protein [Synechococcus sp. BA-132 BA5]
MSRENPAACIDGFKIGPTPEREWAVIGGWLDAWGQALPLEPYRPRPLMPSFSVYLMAAGFDVHDEAIELGVAECETVDAPVSGLDLDASAVGPGGTFPSTFHFSEIVDFTKQGQW